MSLAIAQSDFALLSEVKHDALEVDIIDTTSSLKSEKWKQYLKFKNRKPTDHLDGKVAAYKLKVGEAVFIAPLDTNNVRIMNIDTENLKGAAVNCFDMKNFKFSVSRYDSHQNKFIALTTLHKIEPTDEAVEENKIYWLKLYRGEHQESKICSRQVYNMNIATNAHLTCAKFISPFLDDEIVTLDVTTGLDMLKQRLLDIFGFSHSTLMFNIGEFDKETNTIKILPSIHNVQPGCIYYFLLERKSISNFTHKKQSIHKSMTSEIKSFKNMQYKSTEHKSVEVIVPEIPLPENMIKYSREELMAYRETVDTSAVAAVLGELFMSMSHDQPSQPSQPT